MKLSLYARVNSLLHSTRKGGIPISTTITLNEAQLKLKDLIHQLSAGDEIIITENAQPVAKLVGEAVKQRKPRVPGTLRGTVTYMAPDFDTPLEDFKEYMG